MSVAPNYKNVETSKLRLNTSAMDYKLELQKLLTYCIENRNYLKASESSADRTAADAYQDVRVKIHEIFEREGKETTDEPQTSNCIKHAVMCWADYQH